MHNVINEILVKNYDIDNNIIRYVDQKEKEIVNKFELIDTVKEFNQLKIINAMQKARLDSIHFNWTTGYGYGDIGRDKVEEIYSYVFKTEDSLVRPTIVSGTHALTLTLFGLLKPGDELISITGAPYDTLQKVIGIKGEKDGTLIDIGVKYKEIELNDKKEIDIDKVIENVSKETKVLLIQRSTGYSDRKAITIDEIELVIKIVKKRYPSIIFMIDNCYGEFVETKEPSEVGADIIAGSLTKNPGGGLALTGGYISGKKHLIKKIANRSTAPGIGKECGLTFGTTRSVLQGLFLAPNTVAEALKGAILAAKVFGDLNFRVFPGVDDKRSDIIQAIEFKSSEKVIKFCQGIQNSSPVESHIIPEPWDMPGYQDKVIMAAGAFIQGSSIELSADAPIRSPYIAYLQGGLTYSHCKLGVMKSLDKLYKSNLIKI